MGRMPLGSIPRCRVCGTNLGEDNWRIARRREHRRICKDCERLKNRLAAWLDQGIVLTLDEYHEKRAKQAGRCAICKVVEGKRPLVPDHRHDSGQVRDLLCQRCNVAISYLEDTKFPLYQAYLEKWSKL